jgi:hypothetical protein
VTTVALRAVISTFGVRGAHRAKLGILSMLKHFLAILVLPVALLSASAAQAQHYAGHCSQCQMGCGPGQSAAYHDSYYDSSIWPRQYMAPARRGLCQAFDTMISNGWRRNNLLTKYDFAPEGEGLSEAGRLRLEWILTNAPPQRRTIFVQRGVDAQQTADRVEAVQLLASNINPGGAPIDVQETYMLDEGRPAATVDAVFTGFSANQPAPMLPASTSNTTDQ